MPLLALFFLIGPMFFRVTQSTLPQKEKQKAAIFSYSVAVMKSRLGP